jgi:hypothetical protein
MTTTDINGDVITPPCYVYFCSEIEGFAHSSVEKILEYGDRFVVDAAVDKNLNYTSYNGSSWQISAKLVSITKPKLKSHMGPVCNCDVRTGGCTCGRMQWERDNGIST